MVEIDKGGLFDKNKEMVDFANHNGCGNNDDHDLSSSEIVVPWEPRLLKRRMP